jgi:outer membrane protein assembly factor BamB
MGEDERMSAAGTQEAAEDGDPSAAEPSAAEPAPREPTPSEAALARYRDRLRRSRIIYAAVVAGVVAALAVGVGIAWSHGEIAHVTLHTFAPPPPSVGIEAPSQTLRPAWRTSDRIAIGKPRLNGTIVTYGAHTVGGRDARTGKQTWSYTRTDRTVCTAAQLTNTTVAVYENRGNCDEVAAFDSDTGRRRWTRTLDKDRQPITGPVTYQVLSYTFMVTSDTTIYAIDPVTGLDRWTYFRYGCHIQRAVLGSAGALVSQTCSPAVKCGKAKFCARGPQLFLRDGSAGNGDDSDTNADKIKWLVRGSRGVPASADQVLAVFAADGRTLDLLAAKDGAVTQQVPVSSGAATDPSEALATGAGDIIWHAGKAYALNAGDATPVWTADAPAPPTIESLTNEDIPALGPARITVPLADGIGLIDGNDGQLAQRFAATVPAGSRIFSLGTGFLVTNAAGIVAYR